VPELPEVETVRRGLAREIVGREILGVAVSGARTVRRHPPGELGALVGDTVVRIDRFGKYLVLRAASAGDLVVHLRMSGQLRMHAPGDPRAPHTHATIDLGEVEMRFVDPRTFGELFLSEGHDPAGRPVELGSLGPDALDSTVDADALSSMLRPRRVALKTVLLDQRTIAGIGNIYADEICFDARVRPSRTASSLSARATERLAQSIRGVLDAAVCAGGSTLRDARYRGVRGESGAYQDHHAVYARAGAPCPRCGTPIRGIRIGGRSAHYCPKCQR
jgi:formamidopyrimidine-DNA glycosylase